MKPENKKALETRTCPRCGAKLFTRDAFDDRGLTDNNLVDLYCVSGCYSFVFSLDDIAALQQIKFISEVKP